MALSRTAPRDDGMRLARRSLARQSVVVGVVAAAVDLTVFAMSGLFAAAPVPATAAAVLLVLVDLALGAAPGTVALVAVAQVGVRIGACALLHHYGLRTGFGDIGILIAGFRAGAWLSPRESWFVVPILMAGVTVAAALNGAADGDRHVLLVVAVANGATPWLVGRYTAGGGRYVAELEARERRRHSDLALAIADEREAIARDLHDVISHHVSAIGIHAGIARMSLTSDADATTRSLSAVETSTRAAMVDLRRQLDLLHGRDDAADRQPGLANVTELMSTVRAAGLDVALELPDDTTQLPQSLDVTVYRIVQELLTNALRHGDGTAELTISRTATTLTVRQTNPPVAPQPYPAETTHRGLDGIRRRAELFGGTTESGVVDGRWQITVDLPIGVP